MNSLYVMFIPKSKHINLNRSPSQLLFPMPSIIIRLLNSSHWENHLLVSPGFLSTRKNTTAHFYDSFDSLATKRKLPADKQVMLGFLRGMNTVGHYSSLVDDQMNELRANTAHCFRPGLRLDFSGTDRDHRKMVFLYSIENESSDFVHGDSSLITRSNKTAFLNSITVNAVCIGSTNFSDSSYFGGNSGGLGYGEADVVLMAPSPDKTSSDFYDIVGAFSESDLPPNFDVKPESAEVYASIREEFYSATFAKASYEGAFTEPSEYLKSMLELTIEDQFA